MIRFDTRDKKPKVYNIAVISGITVLVILAMILTGAKVPILAVSIIVTVYLGLTILFLVRAFIQQLQYNPYSYNTIYYFGFSLFLISVFISHIVLSVQIAENPQLYEIHSIASLLLGSAKQYMLLSAPAVLIFSILLIVSNISLLRHEVRRFANVLGILLAVLMLAGEVFLYFADFYASGSVEEVLLHEILTNLFACLYLYVECMVIGAAVGDLIAALYQPDMDKDYIIILGCSIRKDGTPTPLLEGRINRALKFYQDQLKATGKAAILVPSGGQGSDEPISESLCMHNYLIQNGVPEEHIMMEDQSRNTYENMKFSKEKIISANPDARIAFSTTNYHVFRSGMMSRRVRMRSQGMGSKTKWYFWPNASVREFAGLLQNHRLKQAIILISMIVIYTGLAFLAFKF